MQAVTITQISPPELQTLIEDSIKKVFENLTIGNSKAEEDALLTVKQAAEFLTLSVPTLYGLISKGEVPVMKRSKRCYFLKQDLINYLKAGRRMSSAEINAEAAQYLQQKKRGLK